jgi:hypothetical protein
MWFIVTLGHRSRSGASFLIILGSVDVVGPTLTDDYSDATARGSNSAGLQPLAAPTSYSGPVAFPAIALAPADRMSVA